MGQDQQSGGGVLFLKKLRVNSSIRRYSLGARGESKLFSRGLIGLGKTRRRKPWGVLASWFVNPRAGEDGPGALP